MQLCGLDVECPERERERETESVSFIYLNMTL